MSSDPVTAVYEVEMKFPVEQQRELASRLDELGTHWGNPLQQADTYFRHPSRDFGRTDEALRIREVGGKAWITYKGPRLDQQTKTRRELELPLGDGSAAGFAELLRLLGFERVAQVRKTRRPGTLIHQTLAVQVAWDQVDEVGEFLELEATANSENVDSVRESLLALSGTLGLGGGERRSYLELLLEERGR